MTIDGLHVPITRCPRSEMPDGAHGEFLSSPAPHIRLADDLDLATPWGRRVLLHEWVHAVLYLKGASCDDPSQEEAVCDALSTAIQARGWSLDRHDTKAAP